MDILEFKNMFTAAKRTASNFDEFCAELELYLEAAKKSADTDYSEMTDADFDRILEEVVSEMSAPQILVIGEVNSILREELNNEVLTRWEKEQADEDNKEASVKNARKFVETPDYIVERIGEKVAQGYTSGREDDEIEEDMWISTSWGIDIKSWNDDED